MTAAVGGETLQWNVNSVHINLVHYLKWQQKWEKKYSEKVLCIYITTNRQNTLCITNIMDSFISQFKSLQHFIFIEQVVSFSFGFFFGYTKPHKLQAAHLNTPPQSQSHLWALSELSSSPTSSTLPRFCRQLMWKRAVSGRAHKERFVPLLILWRVYLAREIRSVQWPGHKPAVNPRADKMFLLFSKKYFFQLMESEPVWGFTFLQRQFLQLTCKVLL